MKFLARSALVLLALYGMVFAIAEAFLAREQAPSWMATLLVAVFLTAQFLLSPWIIEWVFSIDWDETELPPANHLFVERLCAAKGLPRLRVGVIHSETPNAFSFGRFRRDARVVVTKGLLDVLTVNEANAVLAHEVGHVAHYDFAVMTMAAAVPLLLYQMYVWGDRTKSLRTVSWCAYGAYLMSQFLVLTLNRTREYWADHFAAECTHAPNDLSSALVKIAYGMVRADGKHLETLKAGTNEGKKLARHQQQMGGALALMGISNLRSGSSLALGMANPAEAAAVMRWDLVNPWARVYEMGSTHPLTALRVRSLNRTADAMHVVAGYPLPFDQQVQWSRFPVEFFLWAAPFVCVALVLVRNVMPLPPRNAPWLLLTAGVTWAIRIGFRYRGRFAPEQVGTLLADMEVSQMTPRAVELRGTIVGNGVPGAFWSPDLVLQDETGLMFVLYRSSIPLGRLLFAMNDADRFIGEEVVVRGWYRRGLRPYVEFSEISGTVRETSGLRGSVPVSLLSQMNLDAAERGTTRELRQRSYSRWIQMTGAAVLTAGGVFWLLH